MADLGGLTQKIAGRTVGAVKSTVGVATGVAMGAYNTVKSGVVQSTGINRVTPRNIAASTLDRLGLEAFIPALLGRGGGQGAQRDVRGAAQAASTVAASSKPLENLLNQLISINEAILDTNKGILSSMKEQNQILLSGNDLTKKQMLANIEAAREAAQVKPETGGAENDPAKKQSSGLFGGIFKTLASILGIVKNIGGFLGTLLTTLGGVAVGLFGWLKGIKGIGAVVASVGGFFGKVLAPLSGFFAAISGFFSKLLSFAGRVGTAITAALEFLAPVGRVLGSLGGAIARFGGMLLSVGKFFLGFIPGIAQVVGALLALERTDWSMMFDNLSKVFGDLAEGRFLDAIVRTVGSIGDVILKSVGRIVQTLLEFFGLETAAKAVKDFLDTFNLAEFLVNAVNKVIDVVKSIGTMLLDAAKTVGQFASDAWDFFSSIPSKIGDVFSSAADMIGGAIKNVWNFFTSLPGKFVDTVSEYIPSFLKNAFRSLFGGGQDKTPTAAPTPRQVETPRTPQAEAPPAGETRPTTPAVRRRPMIGSNPNTEFVGKSEQEIFDVLVQRYENAEKAKSEAARIYKGLNTERPTYGSPTSGSYTEATDASNKQKLSEASAKSAPVIVNNVPSVTAVQTPSAGPRTSGAASTAPVASHIDRALYGNALGAGVA